MVGDIFQPTHLLFVLVIALLVLGPKRLPEVGRQLGNGIRDFRAAISGEQPDEIHSTPAAGQQAPAPTAPAEHQFAHETGDSVSEEHQFAHTVADSGQDEHQFAHTPADTPASGERPADQPVDPLD